MQKSALLMIFDDADNLLKMSLTRMHVDVFVITALLVLVLRGKDGWLPAAGRPALSDR